jgi:ATP-dependent Clp protease ATP-binding subunit ClpC
MGFGGQDAEEAFRRIEGEILGDLKRSFSPEFINRVDEVIVFHPLGEKELRAIVDILIEEVNETLAVRKLSVEVTPGVREWLLQKAGIEPSTGARPLRRTIQRHLQDAISELLIRSGPQEIEGFEAVLVDGQLSVSARRREMMPSEV